MQVKCLASSILVGLNGNQVANYPLGPDFESDGFEKC